ncbi:MOP flippase family protein [Balneolaceae bacterium ANBcel3]|nr:MOP flippase family protein [Balneolaceae bacterium ANBcel3]
MSLREKAYSGFGWSGLSGATANALELLKYIFLARILDPSDFGLLAMAMVLISIMKIFSDGGTSNAVIHFDGQSNKALSTLFWINILAGWALFFAAIAIAPAAAAFYKQPEISAILMLAAFILPLYAFGALFEVLLRKNLLFKSIAFAEISGSLTGLIVAIVLGISGFGVYALIWANIITAGIMSMLFAMAGLKFCKPSFYFKPNLVRSHLKFGLFQMGERGLNVYSTRIDQLIIGRFFGPEILGAYHIAWQIVLFPVIRLSPLLNRVAFPLFAGKKDDHAFIRNGYLKLIQAISSLITPFLLLVAVTAPWLVPFLFGDGWELAIHMIPLMALIAFFRMLGNPCGNIILAKGRARLAFYWTLFVALANTLLFLIAAHFSIFILLWSFIAANVLYFLLGQHLMVNRIIELPWIRFARSILPFFFALSIPSAAVIWIRSLLCHDFSDIAMLLSLTSVFLILYIPLVWYFFSDLIRDFFSSFAGRKPTL